MDGEVLEVLQVSHLSNLALVLPVMLARYGISCLMTSAPPHLFCFWKKLKAYLLTKASQPRFYYTFVLSL